MTTCPDGYVRVLEDAFRTVELRHLFSQADEELTWELSQTLPSVLVAGYTEWTAKGLAGGPVVSVGWDWYLDGKSGELEIQGTDVRSNLMFVRPSGDDAGTLATSRNLRGFVLRTRWQDVVLAQVYRDSQLLH